MSYLNVFSALVQYLLATNNGRTARHLGFVRPLFNDDFSRMLKHFDMDSI